MYSLRPYQQRAVHDVHAAWANGAKRICLTLPTGSGKSFTATEATRGLKALWLVHTMALRDQAPGDAVTVQSLLGGKRPKCDVLIADEIHHMNPAAPQWNAVARDYPKILGLTATPAHASGAPLGDLCDHLVVGAHYSELVEGGYLVPARVVRPVDVPDGESGLAQHPVDAWSKYAGDRPGFAFFGRVELAKRFAAEVPRCGVIYGDQDPVERGRTMAAFREGALDVLASVQTIVEGLDVPRAEACMLASGVSHEGAYLQKVGRVLRPAPGKTEAIVIDLPGASWRFGLPTDDREYSLEGTALRRAAGQPSISQCLDCGAVYEASPVCPRCGWERPPKPPRVRIWGVAMEEAGAELTPAQASKLAWRERMMQNEAARLAWFRAKGWPARRVAGAHQGMFGCAMPRSWHGRLRR